MEISRPLVNAQLCRINTSDVEEPSGEQQNCEITSSKEASTTVPPAPEPDTKPVKPSNSGKKPRKIKKNLRQKLKSNLARPSAGAPPAQPGFEQETFPCAVCDKSFSSRFMLKKHNKFHVKKQLPCPYCHEVKIFLLKGFKNLLFFFCFFCGIPDLHVNL